MLHLALAAAVRVVLVGELALDGDDIHVAVGQHGHAEGAVAEAVAVHFLGVELLQVEEQLAEAALIVLGWLDIVSMEIDDIELVFGGGDFHAVRQQLLRRFGEMGGEGVCRSGGKRQKGSQAAVASVVLVFMNEFGETG